MHKLSKGDNVCYPISFHAPGQPAICIVSAVTLFALLSVNVQAQEQNSGVTYFDTMVVTASKTEQRLGDVAGTIEVVSEADIQQGIVDSVDDIFRFNPSVKAPDARADSIGIRGIDGNRVLITVDGVKQPKELDFGPLKSGRNFIDPNTLKQVEVVPGPASSLYGSDAMAGVVAYTTKEPSDVFKVEGDGVGGGVTLRYNGANEGFTKSARVAGRKGNTEAMLIITGRDANETDNNGEIATPGPTYEKPDPRDIQDTSVLGKVNIDVNDVTRLKFTAEQVKSEDELTQLRTTAAFSDYTDESTKTRFSAELDYEQPTAAFDSMSAKLDWQDSETDSLWFYQFGPAPATYLGMYDEETRALNLAFDKALQLGTMEHQFSYGLSLEQQDYAQIKDSSSGIARSMPKSEQSSVAVYVQDEIQVNDKLAITPGVRFDTYTIAPKPDADYLAGGPADENPADNEGSQTSFKLGMTYDVNDQHSFFAQFAQGFKAPDMDQLYTNSFRPYLITLPNPDLDPESSNSFELGYRFGTERSHAEVVVFHNDYEDFIEDSTISEPGAYPPVVQTQNLSGVVIKGVEVKGRMNLTDTVSVRGAVAYAEGTYEKNGEEAPLNSISPLNGTVAVRYDAPGEIWGSELAVTAASGKERSDVDPLELGTEDPFLPGGYGVFDITAYYKLGKNARIDAGLFNVTDKKYWDWDTIDSSSGHAAALARTEAGRHAKVGLTVDF